ncbi:MAG: DUF6443 domain-containing protein [Bacteroidota bacterium]
MKINKAINVKCQITTLFLLLALFHSYKIRAQFGDDNPFDGPPSKPIITHTPASGVSCNPTTYTFRVVGEACGAYSGYELVRYKWYRGSISPANFLGDSKCITRTISSGSLTVRVVAYNVGNNEETPSDAKQVTVNGPSAPSLVSSSISVCGGGPVNFNTTSSGSYKWYTSGNVEITNTNQFAGLPAVVNGSTRLMVTANSSSGTNYKVARYDPGSGCTSSKVNVYAYARSIPGKPVISPPGPLGSQSSGGSSSFTLTANSSGATIDRYEWFSSGSSNLNKNSNPETFVVAENTSESVKVKAFSVEGCQSVFSDVVTMSSTAPPTPPDDPVIVSMSGPDICAPQNVEFRIQGKSCDENDPNDDIANGDLQLKYRWYDVPSGGVYTEAKCYQKFISAPSTSVFVEVYDNNTGLSSSRVGLTVSVNDLDAPTVTNAETCVGGPVLLRTNTSGTYNWYTSSGSPITNTDALVLPAVVDGGRNLSVEATSQFGTEYKVARTNGICESDRVSVYAYKHPIPGKPVISSTDVFDHFTTEIITQVISANSSGATVGQYLWYEVEDGSPDTLLDGGDPQPDNNIEVTIETNSIEKRKVQAISDQGCESIESDVLMIASIMPIVVDPPNFSVQLKGEGIFKGFADVTLYLSDFEGTVLRYFYSEDGGPENQINSEDIFLPVNLINNTSSPIIREYWAEVSFDNGPTKTSSVANITINPFPQTDPLNQNYVHQFQPRVELLSDVQIQANPETVNESITYFDGLGRSVENINIAYDPFENDLVIPITYDEVGRQDKNYLPYPASQSNGSFVEVNTAISNQSAWYSSNKNDSYAYSESKFEPSPLNRVKDQYAPGEAWQDHPIEFDYLTNGENEVMLLELNDLGNLIQNDHYGPGELYLTVTTDEHGKQTKEYKDKEGRVVLKAVQSGATAYAKTYYVYDDFGQLAYVLPPESVEEIERQQIQN